jgi:hypothetical protein
MAAAANIVTLTFESIAPGIYSENLVENGFRISPCGHVDIFPTGPGNDLVPFPSDGNTLGWDSACIGNPDYLGPPVFRGFVYLDFFEHPFSFLSFDSAGFPEIEVSSSKGGLFTTPDCRPFPCDWTHHDLSGPEWEGAKWILFHYLNDPGVPGHVIDNLVFRIASPGTLALLVIGLAGLGFSRRKRP